MNFKFDRKWIKDAGTSILAFGNKNAPAIMTGVGIIMFWGAGYLFWQECKKAEIVIHKREAELQSTINVEKGESAVDVMQARSELSKKDKFVIYLEYCWLSWALGAGATALLVGAQKISIDRLTSMYLMTKFLEDKNSNQETVIKKLKEKLGIKDDSKDDNELTKELNHEKYSDDTIKKMMSSSKGEGDVFFIDDVTGRSWWDDVLNVTNGISECNSILVRERDREVKKRFGSEFFSSDTRIYDSDDGPLVYSSLDLETFLEAIGELEDGKSNKYKRSCKLGELLEFRYYGGGDLLTIKGILNYDDDYQKRDPNMPLIVHIDYESLLSKTHELEERDPL